MKPSIINKRRFWMRSFFLLLILFTNPLMSQHSLYSIRYESIDGGEVKMASYAGKKLVVAAISPENLEKGGFRFLDSLQAARPEIVVIVIPSKDFGGQRNNAILDTIRKNRPRKVQFSAFSTVKKGRKTDQHPLLRWLTSSDDNGHFNLDVSTDNQLYIVNESGVLYAALGKGVSVSVINEALNQEHKLR